MKINSYAISFLFLFFSAALSKVELTKSDHRIKVTVNGTNFWKNTKTSPQIRHVSIDAVEPGENTGLLSATCQ